MAVVHQQVIPGIRKAAIVMLLVGEELSAEVFKHLSEEEIEGLLAVCLQHEMDHLNGVLFIDHLSRLKRDMVLKKLAKWRKEQPKKAA